MSCQGARYFSECSVKPDTTPRSRYIEMAEVYSLGGGKVSEFEALVDDTRMCSSALPHLIVFLNKRFDRSGQSLVCVQNGLALP